MRNRNYSTGIPNCYIDYPKNQVYQHQTAAENFHLVKRVFSVKPTVNNAKPK
jgi:hypothetical protein